MSAVARRTGPARQRAAAAWLPRAAPTARVKALSGWRRVLTAHPAPPDRSLAALARSADRCLACAAAAPTSRVHAPLSEGATHRCPSRASPCRRLRRREILRGERRPTASPHCSLPVELELTLLSLLTVAGPPPATVAPPHRGDAAAEPDFFSSPSTRSSGELACRPSCPAGSLTAARAISAAVAPSPAAPRRAHGSGDRSGVRRAVAGRAGRSRPSERRPRPWPRAAHALCTWAEPTPRCGPHALCVWAEREFGPVHPVKFY